MAELPSPRAHVATVGANHSPIVSEPGGPDPTPPRLVDGDDFTSTDLPPAGLANEPLLLIGSSLGHSLLSLPMSNGSNWIASYTWGMVGHSPLRDVYVWAKYPTMMVVRGRLSTLTVTAGPILPRALLATPSPRGGLPCLVHFAPPTPS